jgi:hypothetical protein
VQVLKGYPEGDEEVGSVGQGDFSPEEEGSGHEEGVGEDGGGAGKEAEEGFGEVGGAEGSQAEPIGGEEVPAEESLIKAFEGIGLFGEVPEEGPGEDLGAW